nr:MAG TPA: hypothetical protein [Caudoviricetes sp.]
MSNLAETLEPEAPTVEWKYDLDQAAEDAKRLHKLRDKATLATGMIDKEIAATKKDLAALEARRKEILEPLQEEMKYLEANLTAYHRQQLEQGGDKTIKLPWATLKSQKKPQDYIRDDDRLLGWVQDNAADYVKVSTSVAWGELKKQLVVAGGKVLLKETGEVVEGVEPKPVEISFNVEVL